MRVEGIAMHATENQILIPRGCQVMPDSNLISQVGMSSGYNEGEVPSYTSVDAAVECVGDV